MRASYKGAGSIGGVLDLFHPQIRGHAFNERSKTEKTAPEHSDSDAMEGAAGRIQG